MSGFEPLTNRLSSERSTTELHDYIQTLERIWGFEPQLHGLEDRRLDHQHTRNLYIQCLYIQIYSGFLKNQQKSLII